MTSTVILTGFGLEVPARDKLGVIARGIAAAMGGGRPAAWAGFVSYQPCATLAALVEQRSEGRRVAT